MPIIPNMLPPDMRLIISRKMTSIADPTNTDLLCLFEEELVARERECQAHQCETKAEEAQDIAHTQLFFREHMRQKTGVILVVVIVTNSTVLRIVCQ